MSDGRTTKKAAASFGGLASASKNASNAARGASRKRDTGPELALRRALWRLGLRYRVDVRTLPGRPDIVFANARVAVFCDGDFWHGRNFEERRKKLQAGHNAPYWVEKIGTNKRPHEIYIDPNRSKVTLMLGVHDDLDLFIAVDPMMHTPTWFSSSIEFKEHDLESALESGWHGWERERSAGRRRATPKEDAERENLRTEALVAFTSEHLVRFIQFERVATGLDSGERLLLVDRIGKKLHDPPQIITQHPLELQLGLSANEILDVIGGRFRLFAAVRGSVAEHHLEQFLKTLPDVSDVVRLDEDGQPEFTVRYRRRDRIVRIECKNVLRKLAADGPRVDFQKTRASKGDPCSRYYSPAQFEILAACLHAVTEDWEFRFQTTSSLGPHKKCAGKLSDRVVVSEPPWTATLPDLLDRLTG